MPDKGRSRCGSGRKRSFAVAMMVGGIRNDSQTPRTQRESVLTSSPQSRSIGEGLKSLFHKLETYGGQCLQIPDFTGMTRFGAALRVVGKNDVANRRAVYGPTLERGLLKHPLQTLPYAGVGLSRTGQANSGGATRLPRTGTRIECWRGNTVSIRSRSASLASLPSRSTNSRSHAVNSLYSGAL